MVKYNCTANAIVPGFVATRMTDSTPRGQQVLQQTGKPMSEALKGTETDPANVAPIVVYLATPEAQYINGQFIGIQGYAAGRGTAEAPYAGPAGGPVVVAGSRAGRQVLALERIL